MTNILEKIIEDKKESLKIIKNNNSLNSLEDRIKTINTFLNLSKTPGLSKTGSEILMGSGSVFSYRPSTGSKIKKWKK